MNIAVELLFAHGHFATPNAVRALAAPPAEPAPSPSGKTLEPTRLRIRPRRRPAPAIARAART